MENDAVHIESHKGIHHGIVGFIESSLFLVQLTTLTGLDALTAIVNNYKKDPSTYKPEEMRTCLDSWRQVLFTHLDDEVRRTLVLPVLFHSSSVLIKQVNDLRGENMKKYWKLEELEQIPM